ncbi:hypothetical protein PR048_005568 [Dryococelus australis]|uniref:PiggyBac transposable element-derived protein domain-containing protein n=1 Tax=Dryococelus australis TaxID=614101 RepID=A0ABQ9I939_9NEOP|nr:hypothetical protein PR048_005568 [Dryococelus australis]
MAAQKRSDIFVCGKDDEAIMHCFEMLTSESSSNEDEMDCDNFKLVAANQSHEVDNETDNSSSETGEDNTAVDTSCGDVVDWKWEQSLAEPQCHPFTSVSKHIVEQTNKNGSSDSTFVSTTPDEFRVHLALLIFMRIVQKPTLQSYCSKEVTVDTPYFRGVMPKRHFVALNKYLHLVDNETLDRADLLRKIRPIITMDSDLFQAVYTPPGSVCIDESLMKCRGRLHFIQYNKSKHAGFGIKLYQLCDSANSYICDFKIWDTCNIAIVMEMMHKCDLLNKGYSYIDNWYSLPELFHRLFSAGKYVCVTIRTNRKHVQRTSERKIEIGEAVAYSCTNITAMKWKDKREVNMLSTKHTHT